MSELIIILQAIGLVVLSLVALAILIPLIFYLHKKRTTSNIYRRIEATILFGLFAWWTHGWSTDEEYLLAYWIIIIMGFCFLHIMLWANPVKPKKVKKK